MKYTLKAMIVILALIMPIMLACSDNDDSDGDDSVDDGPVGGDPEGDGTALFLYRKDFNYYLGVHAYSDLGAELLRGLWSEDHAWEQMTKFDVGDEQYIMAHRNTYHTDTNAWWIQQIYSTVDLGPVTDSGTWSHHFDTLVGCKSGVNSFVFGQNSDNKYWFIQQVLPGGKLGNQTSSGTWHDYYPVAVPLEMHDRTYIYFQSSTDESSQYYWFIARLSEDGHLHQTDDGYWNNLYHAHTAFELDGMWYFFGIRKPTAHQEGVWFIQHVLHAGTMGAQTDGGTWELYYPTVASYVADDGKPYLFVHRNNDDYSWKIYELRDGGKLGGQTSSGKLEDYYEHAFPIDFNTLFLHDDDWMSAMNSVIGDRKLTSITLPGSHDAGVNKPVLSSPQLPRLRQLVQHHRAGHRHHRPARARITLLRHTPLLRRSDGRRPDQMVILAHRTLRYHRRRPNLAGLQWRTHGRRFLRHLGLLFRRRP